MNMAKVKMYTTLLCPFCVRAKMLLKHPFPAGESYVVMVIPIADEALRVQASMDLAEFVPLIHHHL